MPPALEVGGEIGLIALFRFAFSFSAPRRRHDLSARPPLISFAKIKRQLSELACGRPRTPRSAFNAALRGNRLGHHHGARARVIASKASDGFRRYLHHAITAVIETKPPAINSG
jgi:hypothetical protein